MAFKDYLPSKELQKKLLAILLILAVIAGIFLTVRLIRYLVNKRWVNQQIKNLPVELRDQVDVLTIGELQKKDSNSNNIPDWEERLYGLDPFGNGESNRASILEKKAKLREATGASSEISSEMNNNTGKFSREFLSIVLSLQQSGALNQNAVNDIAKSVGQELIPSEIKDYVKKTDLKIVRDSQITNEAYYDEIINIVENDKQSAQLGLELDMLADGLNGANPNMFIGLDEISANYKSVADKFKKVSVPESFAGDHLALVNSLYNIANSLEMIKKLDSDPVIALQGFYIYGTANQVMDRALISLAE